MVTAEILVFLALGLLAYTYAGYPILLSLICLLKKRRVSDREYPTSASVVVVARNAESLIGRRIANRPLSGLVNCWARESDMVHNRD